MTEQERPVVIKLTPELIDRLDRHAFGMTRAEARANGICLECREPAAAKCYSEAGKREYGISGMCEICFDKLFGE